ncbi:MAG: glycosidase, partial [Clostridia bacterium]|nr:glycosidase [Clostridia bacterium]
MPHTGTWCIVATRRAEIRQADCSRIITRLFIPGGEDRVRRIIDRVLSISEEETASLLDQVMEEFAHRHRRFIETLQKHFQAVAHLVPEEVVLSDNRKLLLGAYFTSEYSIQAAGVLNPSITLHPNQADLREGQTKYFMTFRCVGEGHISSLEFRSCIIDDHYQILTKPISCHVETPELLPNGAAFDKGLFEAKLRSRGLQGKSLTLLLQKLPELFTTTDLNEQIDRMDGRKNLGKR